MTILKNTRFKMGGWLVEPGRVRLSNDDRSVVIRPKEMDLLVILAEAGGEVVTTQSILDRVWDGVAVNNDSVYFALSQLRKMFADDAKNPKYIETIPKRGYRIVCDVEWLENKDPKQKKNKEYTATTDKPSPVVPTQNRFINRSFLSIILLVASFGLFIFKTTYNQQEETITTVEQLLLPTNAIAVMPFDDLSEHSDQAFFSDGITNEIVNQLSRFGGLKVVAKTSSLAVKKQALSIPEIGKALKVGTVMEGSVSFDGEQVRISVQLIDTNNGYQMWAKNYQRKLDSIFKIQDEISRSIVSALLPELGDKALELKQKISQPYDTRAYLSYLKGLDAMRISSIGSIESAMLYFEDSIGIEPRFADALSELANAKLQYYGIGASADETLLTEAKDLLNLSLSIAPENARVHVVLAQFWHNQDPKACEKQLMTALDLIPNDVETQTNLAFLIAKVNPIETNRLLDKALLSDPFNDRLRLKIGSYLVKTGEYIEGLKSMKRAAQLNPRNPGHWTHIALTQLHIFGNLKAAIVALEKAIKLDDRDVDLRYFQRLAYLSLQGTYLPDSLMESTSAGDQANGIRFKLENNSDTQDKIERALEAFVKVYYAVLQGDPSQGMLIAKKSIEGGKVRSIFGYDRLLMVFIVNQYLKKGKARLAEDFLLENSEDLNEYLTSIDQTSLDLLETTNPTLMVIMSYANVLKNLGKEKELAALLKPIENYFVVLHNNSSMQELPRYWIKRGELYALRGRTDAALDSIEMSVQKGLGYLWQFTLLENEIFSQLRTMEKFTNIVTLLQQKLELQKGQLPEFGHSKLANYHGSNH